MLSEKLNVNFFGINVELEKTQYVLQTWPTGFISKRPNSSPTKLTNCFHCIIYSTHPFFGWDQHSPFLFNCQQVPLIHVTVSNVLKVMGVMFVHVLHVWVRHRLFFFFFAVPSSVLTSEALLPRRSSQYPPPSATPWAHSASWPHPQRSTGGDVRSLVGCRPKETLHCCWVTSVVFSSACSDWTYARHHLLCPQLTTMLAKSRSQTEWASPQRADHRYIPPPIFLCGLSDVEGFIRTAPGKGEARNTKTEATTRVWHEVLQKLRLF